MALTNSLSTFLAVLFLIQSFSYYFNPHKISNAVAASEWAPAGATWYGDPNGAGSDGGACGYGPAVSENPFSSMVAAGGPSLFNSGKGCGTCFQVKCTEDVNNACSGNPVTVAITDSCPGGTCASDAVHFDFSGTALGAMAKPGQADNLRRAGYFQIQYMRVKCNYPGTSVVFKVDGGSNPYYLAMVIEYEDGDGDIGRVEVQEDAKALSEGWMAMAQSWGAVWMLNPGRQIEGPLSIRLTTIQHQNTLVAQSVIPAGWQPGQTYRSHVNFN